MRWRQQIMLALADTDDGQLSWLERRYVHGVERPHRFPSARRQVRIRQRNGNRYLDNLYEEYRVCVELDGTAAHPIAEQWRDKRRDNWNLAVENIVTLRFGFLDVHDQERQCETAALVARLLLAKGLPLSQSHSCGASCPVRP